MKIEADVVRASNEDDRQAGSMLSYGIKLTVSHEEITHVLDALKIARIEDLERRTSRMGNLGCKVPGGSNTKTINQLITVLEALT